MSFHYPTSYQARISVFFQIRMSLVRILILLVIFKLIRLSCFFASVIIYKNICV